MAVTITTVQKMYKDVFRGDAPQMLALKDKPAMSRLRKVDDLEGYKNIYPIRVNLHTGASHDFSDAQDYDTATDIYRFELQPKSHYAVVNFDAKAMAAARSNVGSYLRLKAKEIQETLEYVGQRMEREFWRGLCLGRVTAASNIAGNQYRYTLSDATDVINFYKGQKLQGYSATSATADAATRTGVVDWVEHADGKIVVTLSGADDWVAGVARGYLFVVGDRTAGSPGTLDGWTGVNDYIPSSNPSASESFQGLDRSVSPNFLAGWRGTQYATNEESIQQLAVLQAPFVSAIQGKTEVWMNPKSFHVLQAEAGARLVRDPGESATLGYSKCKVNTAMGALPVMVGAYVPASTAFLLDWSTWSVHTLKPLLHLVDEDGNEMLRKATADEFEMRWRSWSEILCDTPVKNGRVTVNT